MHMMKKIVFGICFLAWWSTRAQTDDPYLLLVSFDGFRQDYTEHFDLPNFTKFISEGSAAEGLIPCFPSKTFPNHYAIVTGLYPGNHGLVDNQFYDPQQDKHYSPRSREMVTDKSFYGGVPIWQLARKHGLKTASYFWVGSELKEETLRPDRHFLYDHRVPFEERVSTVLSWFELPPDERPRFISLYFSSPDTESHRHGPFSPQTRQVLTKLDSLLGVLVEGVKKTALPVNILLVSDHGMSTLTTAPETFIFLNELLGENEDLVLVNNGTQVHIYTTSDIQTDKLFERLKTAAGPFQVYRRETLPPAWHYNHPRVGNLLLVADPKKIFTTATRQSLTETGGSFGTHGYDPDTVAEMRGIFYAKGPNIRPGVTLPAFRNIHVYPLMARILGLEAGPVDGDFEVVEPIYLE